MTGNQLLTPVSEDDENGKLLARIEAALDRLDRLTDAEALRRTAAEDGTNGYEHDFSQNMRRFFGIATFGQCGKFGEQSFCRH